MALQGMNVKVHDIDLQTDKDSAYEIEKYLSEYVVQPVAYSEAERIKSHFGTLTINGVKIEIMGAIQKRLGDKKWEEPVRVEKYKHWIETDGIQIPVLSLAYEYQAYLKLGRKEKAKMLKRWLQNQNLWAETEISP